MGPADDQGTVRRLGLFDANAHPDVRLPDSGRAGDRPFDTYAHYRQEARAAGFIGACAVGLPGTDPVEHLDRCSEDDLLIPVAPWTTGDVDTVGKRISKLRVLGYRALKVHPRLGGTAVGSPEFHRIVEAAGDAGMVVFLCTYPFGGPGRRTGDTLLGDLEQAVDGAPDTRLVLLHGGTVDLLRYIEFCRANPHLLLDVSLTLMKYQGSSLDDDLRFAFRQFDRRVCVGSDYPWYGPGEVANRIDDLLDGVDEERCRRILRGNIEAYLQP